MALQATRQSELYLASDWQAVYQAFTNVDFRSYDFTTIKQALVNYIQVTYPEDFTDWSNSSEFLFIIDLLSFLGEALAYRIDLNSRENFMDTAQTKDSIIRLAKMLSYQSKRNQPARGLVKIMGVRTSQSIIDSFGTDFSNKVVWWNDPTNANWYEQCLLAFNKAFQTTNPFGTPSKTVHPPGSAKMDLYTFNSVTRNDIAIGFGATVNGDSMSFEIVNPDFDPTYNITVERTPNIDDAKHIIYTNDGTGYSSPNTGFFLPFKQGVLKYEDFSISTALANRVISLSGTGINESDVWVQEINTDGSVIRNWVKVPSTNTLVFNSLSQQQRNIFSTNTLNNDKVEIVFPDGNFGNVPTGMFRIWYRESNGLTYTLKPEGIQVIPIIINYYDNTVNTTSPFSIQLYFSLQNSVSNAAASESTASVKLNAPRVFYSQGRMVNGEDYNSFPLSVGPSVVKFKAVNRTYSGHSPFIDITDPTKQYSNTIEFGDDGVLYKENYTNTLFENYPSTKSYLQIIETDISTQLVSRNISNFFYDNTLRYTVTANTVYWYQNTSSPSSSSGYFSSSVNGEGVIPINDPYATGSIKYFQEGALLCLTDGISTYWASIQSITNNGVPIIPNVPTVTIDQKIQSNWWVVSVIPAFRSTLTDLEIASITTELQAQRNFGLRFDYTTQQYFIIKSLDLGNGTFSYANAGDTSSTNKDNSWLIRVDFNPTGWNFSTRLMRYVFESAKTSRFYFDSYFKSVDNTTNTANFDTIKILKYNTIPNTLTPFGIDYNFTIADSIRYSDGYIEPRRVQISLVDSDQDGVMDNPNEFQDVVGNNQIFQTQSVDQNGYYFWAYTNKVSTDANPDWTKYSARYDGTNFYDSNGNILTNYRTFIGRDSLNYSWKHYAPSDIRIDPAISNIMDAYVLTSGFYQEVQNWALGGYTGIFPTAPSNTSLRNEYADLEKYKMQTDQLIWNSAKFKLLFGPTADPSVQAIFKVVKAQGSNATDNEIKQGVITAINNFFNVANFDFGETFFFTELSTYIHLQMITLISSVVIVPNNSNSTFGDLFQIRCAPNELFLPTATVANVIVIPTITLSSIRGS